MSKKVVHVACPRCREQGKDTRGDNLAVYPDGSKFCFSCGYYVLSRAYVPQEGEVGHKDKTIHVAPGIMPENMRRYLRQYLTDREIQQHFVWDLTRHRAALIDLLPSFYWGRDATQGRSKVYTYGEVPYHIFGREDSESDTLVVVEDPISAIVVGRVCRVLCLFGAYLRPTWYPRLLVSGCKNLVFWLDYDKKQESLSYALTFRHLFNTDYVVTVLDPKQYDTTAIRTFLELKIKSVTQPLDNTVEDVL